MRSPAPPLGEWWVAQGSNSQRKLYSAWKTLEISLELGLFKLARQQCYERYPRLTRRPPSCVTCLGALFAHEVRQQGQQTSIWRGRALQHEAFKTHCPCKKSLQELRRLGDSAVLQPLRLLLLPCRSMRHSCIPCLFCSLQNYNKANDGRVRGIHRLILLQIDACISSLPAGPIRQVGC